MAGLSIGRTIQRLSAFAFGLLTLAVGVMFFDQIVNIRHDIQQMGTAAVALAILTLAGFFALAVVTLMFWSFTDAGPSERTD